MGLIFSIALNETLFEMDALKDGANFIRRLWNRSFEGGHKEFFINANGDVTADYFIWDFDPNTKNFKKVMIYKGAFQDFQYYHSIHWPGRDGPPPDEPECGFYAEKCNDRDLLIQVIVLLTALLSISGLCLGGSILYRKKKFENILKEMWWNIDPGKVLIIQTKLFGSKRDVLEENVMTLVEYVQDYSNDTNSRSFMGVIKKDISIKIYPIENMKINRDILIELKNLREMYHENLTSFEGLSFLPGNRIAVLTSFGQRGTLKELLAKDTLELDWDFRMSLIQDLAEGMKFLHSSAIKFHGGLTSSSCVIDVRFVLKVTDFGLKSIQQMNLDYQKHNMIALWKAPEHLRQNNNCFGSQESDVYSFGIILQEIITRNPPFYCIPDDEVSFYFIREQVIQPRIPPYRPQVNQNDCPQKIYSIMQTSWAECPLDRPTFQEICKKIKRSISVMDSLINRMENYARTLENIVAGKTFELWEEKNKVELILSELLPRSVLELLKEGKPVEAEFFENVSIFFSDIVGFTSISAQISPIQVINMLNDIYTLFDNIIQKLNVYKVETIGDAYMVASGLPIPNGDNHALEISKMALEIRDSICSVNIPNFPKQMLKIRIGIHSGSCVAGVVGCKMPRYCLFGKTIIIASKLESTSEPSKIQISSTTKDLLEKFNNFDVEFRGEIKLQENMFISTFWLCKER